MSRGTVTYHLSRPDPVTLRLVARIGDTIVIRGAEMHLPGRKPSAIAHALFACAQRNMLLSRASVVTADWPFELRPDAGLWQRFRDVAAQMPRGETDEMTGGSTRDHWGQ